MLLIFYLAFTLANLSFCQESSAEQIKEKIANVSSEKLQQKILLTDSQTIQVKNLLINYLTDNNKQESNLELLNKINSVLTDRQKSKFEIIKNEWWSFVEKEMESLVKK